MAAQTNIPLNIINMLPSESAISYGRDMDAKTFELPEGRIVDASGRKPKLAEKVANQIAQCIIDSKLEAGSPLGSEADIVGCTNVSRWTMREAIAILTNEGFVEIRRGRGGGLFVGRPALATLSHSIRAYLEFLDVSVEEIIETRRVLNGLVLQLAAQRLTPVDVTAMRTPHKEFEGLLAATRNPATQIFTRSARRFEILALLHSSLDEEEYLSFMSQVEQFRILQIDAVVANDLGEALRFEENILQIAAALMQRTKEAVADMNPDIFRDRANRFLPLITGKKPLKKPELLTYELASRIKHEGWKIGEHLGSEPELLAEYGVGRAVFRETIRSLEQVGIVEMRTGRHSGLKVAAPSMDSVIAGSLLQFARLNASYDSCREIFDALATAVAGQAARQTPSACCCKRDIDISAYTAPELFYQSLWEKSGNRVIAVMMRILIAQMQIHRSPVAWANAHALRGNLIAAIRANDAPLAQRQMILLLKEARF